MTPVKTPSDALNSQPAWRLRSATAGGALAAFGLGVLFNAGAGDAQASTAVRLLSIVLSLAGILLTAVSAVRATWVVRLRRAQAVGSIPVAAAGLLVLSVHDDEPFTATGLLGLVVGPCVLWLILSGVQLLAWQPGAPGRMQREIDRLRDELDQAASTVRKHH